MGVSKFIDRRHALRNCHKRIPGKNMESESYDTDINEENVIFEEFDITIFFFFL